MDREPTAGPPKQAFCHDPALLFGPDNLNRAASRIMVVLYLHQPVPLQREPSLAQPPCPAFPRADAARVIQQAVLLFLGGQPGEFAVQRVRGRQEGFLPLCPLRNFGVFSITTGTFTFFGRGAGF
jgi:hypothetical protein